MRRILVTGANKGIGYAIAHGILAEHEDTFVYLGARDETRGDAARERLLAERPEWRSRLDVIPLDVSSDASVNRAVAHVEGAAPDSTAPLYAVVNNAGVGGSAGTLADVLNVNTIGMRRVSEAFVNLIAAHGRIVNVTSASGPSFVATCSPERQRFFLDPNVEWSQLVALFDECKAIGGDPAAFSARGLGNGDPYGLSKACSNSYTLLLARTHPNLFVNACTPGFIETDMTRGYAASRGQSPAELGMKSPAEGARTPLLLLFGEAVGSGRYYGSDGQRSPLDRYRAPGSEPYHD